MEATQTRSSTPPSHQAFASSGQIRPPAKPSADHINSVRPFGSTKQLVTSPQNEEIHARLSKIPMTTQAVAAVSRIPDKRMFRSPAGHFSGGDGRFGGSLRIGTGASQHGTTWTTTAPRWQAQSQSFAFFSGAVISPFSSAFGFCFRALLSPAGPLPALASGLAGTL